MILDEQSIEQSALYALDLLDHDERRAFEHELRINEDLQECTAEFHEVGAAVALSSCTSLEPPPVSVLANTLNRIAALQQRARELPPPRQPPSLADRFRSIRSWPGMVAACAALLVALGGTITVIQKMGVHDGTQPGIPRANATAKAGEILIMKDGQTVATLDGDERTVRELLRKLERIERLHIAPGVIQDIARLERELKSLRKADFDRYSANPRVANPVVIKMVAPGGGEEDADGEDLASHLLEYFTSIGLTPRLEQAGDPDPGTGLAADQEVIIDPSTYDGSLLEVSEGSDLYYRDFPARSDNHEPIDEGRVLDKVNNLIWVETSEPGVYRAFTPPADFDPDFIEDFTGMIPEAGALPGPQPAPAEPSEPHPAEMESATSPQAEDPPSVETPPPSAVSYYEQTTGRGWVVIDNLPPASEGQVYQLWMRNLADSDQVVSVGILPDIGETAERFDFDLLGPGITPAGFFLTLEPEGGVGQHGDNIILQGP